jgi:hypothetical protein
MIDDLFRNFSAHYSRQWRDLGSWMITVAVALIFFGMANYLSLPPLR